MKFYTIIITFLIAIICMVDGKSDATIYKPRIRKIKSETTTTEAPTTKMPITMKPKEEIKFVEPEKKQPSLSTLYTNGAKRTLMRKFIPKATRKPKTEAVIVSRRPLMKHRQFVISPTTPKPQPIKVDQLTPNRRKLLSPLQKSKQLVDNTPKADDGDEYDQALNDDLMPAGSIKVYRKIIGNFRKRFNVKSSKPIRGKSKYSYYIFKANDIVLEPTAEAYFKRFVEKKYHDINEDEDRKEYIFVPKPSTVSTKADNKGLSTKPTQSLTTQTVSEKLNGQSTPSVIQTIKTDSTFVQSTPKAQEITASTTSTSTTAYKIVDIGTMPNVTPKANVEEQVLTSGGTNNDSNKLGEMKYNGVNDSILQTKLADSTETDNEESPVQSAESVINKDVKSDMQSPRNEAKENNINDLSVLTTQTDPLKNGSDTVLKQSTPNAKEDNIKDTVQSTITSITTSQVASSDDLVAQTTPTLQAQKGDKTLAVGDSIPQDLERTDVV